MTKKKEAAQEGVIVSYKGFDKDLKCRDFQYAVGETFVHNGDVEACKGGFHACEYPLNVFDYYAPAGNRFAVVEQSGQLSRGDDTKVASKTLTVKAEIGLPGLIKAAIEYTVKRCSPVDPESPASSTGDQGAASSTGTRGAASSTGAHSVAMACGYAGRAMAGESGAIVLVYRDEDCNLIHIRASKVGDNGIKAGVWYMLDADSNFVEAQ